MFAIRPPAAAEPNVLRACSFLRSVTPWHPLIVLSSRNEV
jgi:hypothetical protein